MNPISGLIVAPTRVMASPIPDTRRAGRTARRHTPKVTTRFYLVVIPFSL